MSNDESREKKGVLHPSILASKLTNSNQNYNFENGDKSLYQPCETYSNSVSRPPECDIHYNGQVENYSSKPTKNIYLKNKRGTESTTDGRSYDQSQTGFNGPIRINQQYRKYKNRLILVDLQYLGDSILKACNRFRGVLVRSEKGTGKTTAMKAILSDLSDDQGILFVTPRKKLNYALAFDLGLYYYEDVKNESCKERRREMAQRMVITPQSLGAILSEFPDLKYQYVVMDESESVASMMVSEVTRDRARTLAALQQVSINAGNVVMMDAALGVRSEKLADALSGGADYGLLLNTYQRWANIDAELITGGKYTDRVKACDAMQIEAMEQGQRFSISSGSATYCQQRYDVLRAMFPDKAIGLFTSGTSAEVKRILARPELAAEYDAIIFSPAVNIGFSVDVKNHFHLTFGVYPNVLRTGGSDDAIQGLARVRHPVSNHWVVVLDDDKNLFKHDDVWKLAPADISQIVMQRFIRDSFYAGSPVQEVGADASQVAELWAVCTSYSVDDKNNFNSRFLCALRDSGARVRETQVTALPQNDDSVELTEAAKESHKEAERTAKTKSPKLSEQDYEYIKAMTKFRPDDVTPEQRDSMKRYRFERRYNIDCDELEQVEIDHYLDLDDMDVISQCINREIALSDDQFTKDYTKARIAGVGGSDAFKVDLVDEKLSYRLKKALFDYAAKHFDGSPYSHQSLKKGALVRFIDRHREEIVITQVIPLPKNWRTKPALVMNLLMDMCGYDRAKKRKGKGKGRQTEYAAIPRSVVSELCEARAAAGNDWITSTKRLIGLYVEVLEMPEGKTRLERLWRESGRTDDVSLFMAEFADDLEDIERGEYPDDVMLKIVANWR